MHCPTILPYKSDENTKPVKVDAPFKISVGYRPNTSVQRNLYTIHIGVGHVEGYHVPNYSGELNDTNGRNLALISNNTMFTQKEFEDCRHWL
jgi:hypothetical protein